MSRKRNVYFNFGPKESFFVRVEEQHRSDGDIAGRPSDWSSSGWLKFDCVAWKGNVYFACRHRHDRINKSFAQKVDSNLKKWIDARQNAPLRVVFGGEPGNWFAWMLHGDFLAGPNAPGGMVQAARDAKKMYTSIRCASLGVNGTWLLIWEDGDMRRVMNDGEYPHLSTRLASLEADDISWVVLNPFREGDFFLYVDRDKKAYFQVSDSFGRFLGDALWSAGITCTDVVLRKQKITDDFGDVDWEQATANTVSACGDSFLNITWMVLSTGFKVIKFGTQVGGAVAGIGLCNVM